MPEDNNDAVRAENATLRIQCHSHESEIVRLKHALDLAMTKAGSWSGMKQRVTVNKPINPAKEWQSDGQLEPFAASAVTSSIAQQLKDRSHEVQAARDEMSRLNKLLDETQRERDVTSPKKERSAGTSHLMVQIQFLHRELERMEQELAAVRSECVEQLRAAHVEHATVISEFEDRLKQANDEKQRIFSKLGPAARQLSKMENGEDLLSRCRILEGQLAAALAEKNSFAVEKHELMTKLRKLENFAKEKKSTLIEAQRAAAEESLSNEESNRVLQSLVTSLSEDRNSLKEQVATMRKQLLVPRADSIVQCEETPCMHAGTQCDPLPSHKTVGCQVDSIIHFADSGTASLQSVTHILEAKCAEVEELTQQLEQLSFIHRETLTMLDQTKSRFQDEVGRRQQVSEDCERLGLQVRSLQQRTSQQSAAEREKDVRLRESEEKMQDALSSRLRLESELKELKEIVALHHADMQSVVQNQNFANNQINQLASENDALRSEIQKLLHREAQCNFSIRAKEVEIGEILAAYQQCVRESEQHIQARGALEREIDNLRAASSAKEERIINLQDQIGHLHAREQQLALDLQSFDYEGGQLHRKLVQSDARVAQLEAQGHDLVQSLHANERVAEEMERNLAELTKQIVLKDNECMILRQRCDAVEREWSALNVSRQSEISRLRELEDANARLVVRGILAQQNSPAPATRESDQDLSGLRKTLAETTAALSAANLTHHQHQQEIAFLTSRVGQLEASMREELNAKERLQRVVLDQAAILSQLSKQ